MGRPRVRTARLTGDEVSRARRTYVTIVNAFARLAPASTEVGWPVFRAAMTGGLVRPEAVEAIRAALAADRARGA